LYGWWTIQNLLDKEYKKSTHRGKYKLYYYTGDHLYRDTIIKYIDFPETFYHPNSKLGAAKIHASILNTNNKSGVYLLTGLSGLGKTNTAMYLCKLMDYNATVCTDFSIPQYEHFARLNRVCSDIEPADDNFLICVMDEVDDIINYMYNKHADDKEHVGMNKRSWNFLLEQIHLLQNIIFIMTTNKPISYFNELDISFMREYRVTEVYNYTETGVEIISRT
jgi:ATPase family associated with various cellular activities (AAA)